MHAVTRWAEMSQDWPPRGWTEQPLHLFSPAAPMRTSLCQPTRRAPSSRLPAARFLLLGSNQPGERSTFFRESPAKLPPACSGCGSDQLPFHLSPPALKLRNDSLAVFPLLLNAFPCLSMEPYGNFCEYTLTLRHPLASV